MLNRAGPLPPLPCSLSAGGEAHGPGHQALSWEGRRSGISACLIGARGPRPNQPHHARRSSMEARGLFILILIFVLHLALKYNRTNILGKLTTKKSRDQKKQTQ